MSKFQRQVLRVTLPVVFGAIWPKRTAERLRRQASWKVIVMSTVFKTLALSWRPMTDEEGHQGRAFDLGLRPPA